MEKREKDFNVIDNSNNNFTLFIRLRKFKTIYTMHFKTKLTLKTKGKETGYLMIIHKQSIFIKD